MGEYNDYLYKGWLRALELHERDQMDPVQKMILEGMERMNWSRPFVNRKYMEDNKKVEPNLKDIMQETGPLYEHMITGELTNEKGEVLKKKAENASQWDDYAGTWPAEWGHKPIRNEQTGKEEDPQGILKKIKVEHRPADRVESVVEMMKPLQEYANIKIALSQLPEEVQVEIAKEILLRSPAYKKFEQSLELIQKITNGNTEE